MSFFKRAMVYLGLVDVDYDEYEPYDEPAPQPVRRPAPVPGPGPGMMQEHDTTTLGAVRTLPAPQSPQPMPVEPTGYGGVTVQPRSAVVRPISPVQSQKVHVVEPADFRDAPEIADRLKANQPVIVTLLAVNADLSRRLIDFCSGATYALGGSMERVAKNVFLLTPSNVEVSAEEKRRLQERGLYRS